MNSSEKKSLHDNDLHQITVDLQIADDLSAGADMVEQVPLQSLIGAALAAAGINRDVEISVRLVNDSEMADLNQQFRGKAGPTNVLAFPYQAVADTEIPFIGDLAICIPVLQREAAAQSKSEHQHFAHLLLHGTLHLLGYDHQTEEQAEQMEQTERSVLRQFDIPDPYGERAEQ